jgi:hypothetical protein
MSAELAAAPEKLDQTWTVANRTIGARRALRVRALQWGRGRAKDKDSPTGRYCERWRTPAHRAKAVLWVRPLEGTTPTLGLTLLPR